MLRSAVRVCRQARNVRFYSKPDFWTNIEETPLDNIKALTEAFNKDSFPQKVNLGEGVYRDENGKPFVLRAVKEAEKRIFEANLDHEYAPVSGVVSFCNATRLFAFGEDNTAVKEQRIATVQALSGTGALRLAGEFLKRFVPGNTVFYLPNPSWMNHNAIFKNAGFDIRQYRYFNKATNGLDFEGMVADLKAAPRRSVVLLHACAHNPTGVDPTMEQWKELSKITMEKDLIVFFDSAYQGFATGDPVRDAQPFRYFVEQGHVPVVAQSYAKNFGLYGERIGALNVVCNNTTEANNVDSQLKVIVRAMYSNPPIYGARVVSTVLGDKNLSALWDEDLKKMAYRIRDNRAALVQKLAEHGSNKNWSHITSQIGMFAYTGLSVEQVNRIKSEFHVYMTQDGRISIAGINPKNIDYLAKAMFEVTK